MDAPKSRITRVGGTYIFIIAVHCFGPATRDRVTTSSVAYAEGYYI
jgi:hypothetical protein